MLALYRSGRQAEALDAYQDTRRVLVDELGLAPSRAIVELEQAILRQDPALDVLPQPVGAQRPAAAEADSVRGRRADGVFVGRERELAALIAALGDALSGSGRLVVVGGEPGIGKSRLAEELASRARSDGAEIRWGRCWEEGGAPPYWPWVQVLRACVRERGVEQLTDELGAGAAEVAELVPDVRQRLPQLRMPSGSADPQQARFRLFDAVAGFLTRASRSRPLVVVLDDLNWADRGSLLLLEFVARELAETNVVLVGTYRDIDLSRGHPLRQTLAELSRERLFERVLLRGLAHEDVARFIEAACGFEPDMALVEAIHAQTEGNPFFVGEVVRLLREEGALTPEASRTPEHWSARIPDGVREAVGRRLERLSRPCSSTLTIASAIGREFGLDQLGPLVDDLDEEALLEALDEALAAHVVEELPGTAGRYQFTHALIQATLADELSRTRRARLHARIAEALETLYGAEATAHAAELAHHFAEAQSVLGADRLVRYCALAGESALAARAPEQALVHFERAIAANETAPVDDRAAELLFGLGRAQLATLGHAELGPAVASFRRSFEHYVEAGDIRRAVAVAAHPLPLSLRFGYTDAAELIAHALTLVAPDSHEEGRLLAQQGWFSGFIDADYDRAQDEFRRALSIAEREGDSAIERRTLANAAFVDAFHLNWHGCLARGLRAIDLAREDGDPSTEIPASRAVVFALTATGERERVRSLIVPALAHAEQLRESWWLTSTSFSNEVLCLYEGDWQTAREMSDAGLAADPRDPRHLALRAVLAYQLGDDDAGAAYVSRLQEVAESSLPPGPSPTMSSSPSRSRSPVVSRTTTEGWTWPGRRPRAYFRCPRSVQHSRPMPLPGSGSSRCWSETPTSPGGSTKRSRPSGAQRASSFLWPSTGCSDCWRPPPAGSTLRSPTSRTALRSAIARATGPSTRGPRPTTRTPCSRIRAPTAAARQSPFRPRRSRSRARWACARSSSVCSPASNSLGDNVERPAARLRLAYSRGVSAASTRIPPPDSSPNSSSTLWIGAPRRRRRAVTAMRTTAISASVTAVVPAPSA